MNLNLKKLIETSIKDEKNSEKILKIIASKIDMEDSRTELFEELYTNIYGTHLCDDFCIDLVNLMHHDSEKGQKWTLEETNEIAKKVDISFSGKEEDYTEREFWAAMHMMYYDYKNVFLESHIEIEPVLFAKLADSYLADEDAPLGKLSNYFFFLIKNIEK